MRFNNNNRNYVIFEVVTIDGLSIGQNNLLWLILRTSINKNMSLYMFKVNVLVVLLW